MATGCNFFLSASSRVRVEGGRFIHPGLGFSLEFPKGWKTYNSLTNIGAHESGKEAQLHLGVAAGTALTFRTSRTTVFNKSISIASGS